MVYEELSIQGVPAENIAGIWPQVAPLLVPCLHAAEYDEQSLLESLEAKDVQLWVGRRGGHVICAMTTRIDAHHCGKVATILHVGGEFDEGFRDYLPRLKQWAKESGAGHLRVIGRAGWQRWLKEHFETHYTMLEAKL